MALVELKHVGVVSAGKFFAVVGLVFGLLFGILSLVGGMFLGPLAGGLGVDSGMLGVTGLVGGVIGGAVFGFIAGAFYALIYNIIAGVAGGIDVTFTKKEAPGAMPAQTRRAVVAGAAADSGTAKTSGVATAVNAELLNYVKGELAAGRTKEEVVADLVKAGWSQDDVHAALNAAVLG